MGRCFGRLGRSFGTCMTRDECEEQVGVIDGTCSQNRGVCCTGIELLFKVLFAVAYRIAFLVNLKCGETTSMKRVIIDSPVDSPSSCTYTITPTSNFVCQVIQI